MRAFILFTLLAPILAAQSSQVQAALAAGTYFPLDIGDRWVYRIDNRAVTATYETWRMDRTEVINGETWSVMEIENAGGLLGESRFRTDSAGRVYILTGSGDQLFLDPTAQPQPGPELQITGQLASYQTAFGTFQDAIGYQNQLNVLILENGTLVRGIGLASSVQQMLSGSSGGFTEGRTLVEAWLGGGLHLGTGMPSLQLSMESLTLDVSGNNVTNCVVPCYFVACGLVPTSDPPGTYKPCARARVSLSSWPAGASRAVELQLTAPGGANVYQQTYTADAAPDDAVFYVQVPLYSAPNQPFPPGAYQLTATTGDSAAQSSLTVQIR